MRSSLAMIALPLASCPVTTRRTCSAIAFLPYQVHGKHAMASQPR
jgi:hypothetical protein